MTRPRLVAWGIAAILALLCWALLPASANAAAPALQVPEAATAAAATVESTVAEVVTVPRPVQRTVEEVARAVKPAVEQPAAAVSVPAPSVSPIAGAAAPHAPAAAPEPSNSASPKQARAFVARAAGSSPAERPSAGRGARGASERSHRAVEPPAVEPHPVFEAAVREATPAAVASDGVAAAPGPAPQPEQPAFGFAAGTTASVASTSFLFGGGLALLVAALLLAGPGLLRRLTLPPAVCRPAAFVLVLERPG